MSYSIGQISQIISSNVFALENGSYVPKSELAGGQIISELLYDSRMLMFAQQTLFFAIKTGQNDGHRYIGELYERGCRAFVVSQLPQALFEGAFFLQHTNPTQALQILAAHHRSKFTIPIIGITGSNGKTVVKEWLNQLLSPEMTVTRSPKSFNSQIGVPISVWGLTEGSEIGIFEAGISKQGEMAPIEQIIRPTIGILTNIGAAHSSGFDSLDEKLMEKCTLFEHTDLVVFNKDSESIAQALNGKSNLAWSYEEPQNKELVRQLPFKDAASIENAMHCAAVMRWLGYEEDVIGKRLGELKSVPLRLEVKQAVNGCTLVNDSYSADLTSLLVALDFLGRQGSGQPKTLILSDILQSGLSERALYSEIAKVVCQKGITRLVGIGEKIGLVGEFLPKGFNLSHHHTTEDFLKTYKLGDFNREGILLKGARIFGFERIARLLEQKLHKTVLEINLSMLTHNYHVFRSLLRPETKLMCMVKASGYGSGTLEVAKLLEYLKVDYMAVAYTDEGVDLRNAGIKTPILVLNPEESTFDMMLRHGLEPEIYSLNQLKSYLFHAQQREGQTQTIHLKLETGMRRLGFEEAELREAIVLLTESKNMKVGSVFSHLAASDAPTHDDFTRSQVATYESLYGIVEKHLGYRPMRHILNSGGIERFPEYQWEMVRLGIGLYGVASSPLLHDRLAVVSTLKATVSQIKNVPVGETVGYNRNGKTTRDSRIAVISIGYADGFPRKLGNGMASVWVRGKLAPIIGNVCMDMSMVDVTDVPEAAEGDEVEIFGDHIPVQRLAEQLGTISYEVLTMVSDRVSRMCYLD